MSCERSCDEALLRQITDRLLNARSKGMHVQAAKELFAELREFEGCKVVETLASGLGRYIVNEEDLRFQEATLQTENPRH